MNPFSGKICVPVKQVLPSIRSLCRQVVRYYIGYDIIYSLNNLEISLFTWK